jgi:hypothetical protein
MTTRQRIWCGVVAAAAVYARLAAAQAPDRRQIEQIEQTLRQEGQAIVALADAATSGQARSADFTIGWHHDFLKAQAGTFVPFVVTLAGTDLQVPAVLLYVRLARPPGTAVGRPLVVEEIYPIEFANGTDPIRITRGFSAPPGEYDLTVVVRERERERADLRGRRPHAAVLSRPLRVPDYSVPELTTSTVMLAERISPLVRAPDAAALPERPYALGTREVQPRLDAAFRQTEELTVVFLVYHPAVTLDKHFDLEVEYHFFRRDRGVEDSEGPTSRQGLPAVGTGERYVSRTQPQRFNPGVLGPQFDPAAGQPVLAGQSVPLSAFVPGEYRLAITVTDLVAGRAIAREVTFSVRP